MSETQTAPDQTTLVPTLPTLADMTVIDNVLKANVKFTAELAMLAKDFRDGGSMHISYCHLLYPLDVAHCPELGLLTKHGLERNWQYTRLSPTEFAGLVTSPEQQQAIELFMAKHHGLLLGTQFTEEMLRDLQGRQRNIFTDGVRLKIVDAMIASFVNTHNDEFNEVTRRCLTMYWHMTVLWYMRQHWDMNSTHTNITGSKFGQALARYGLWIDFTPTAVEREFLETRRNTRLP